MRLFKQAFTLAEVLITLGIIGIVAAMTIPSLMNQTNDTELKTKWKKSFSTLANATNLMKNDNGGVMTGIFTSGGGSMLTTYSNYLSVAQSCPTNSVSEGCIASQNYKGLDGTGNGGGDGMNVPGMVLADGTSVIFKAYSVASALNCNYSYVPQMCGTIYIDVNGLKGPNTMGRDLFLVFVTQNGLSAVGSTSTSFSPIINDFGYSCNPANTTYSWRGMGCSAMYLMQ